MARQVVKTISNQEIEFIPDDMKDMDRSAKNMLDRPIIVYGKRMTNEQKWRVREIISLEKKDGKFTEGTGEALKYIWDNCITRVLNVVIMDDNQKQVEYPELTGKEKNDLWNTIGIEDTLYLAVRHFQNQSELSDDEAKT